MVYKTVGTGNPTLFLQGGSKAGYTEGFDCQANCVAGDKWEIRIVYAPPSGVSTAMYQNSSVFYGHLI